MGEGSGADCVFKRINGEEKMNYTIYFEGEFLVRDEGFLDSLAPGVFEGRGVFETMRVDDGHVVLLDLHLQRLRQGLKVLGIRFSLTIKEVQSIVHRVVMFNQFNHGRARIMVYQKSRHVELAVMVMPRTVFSEQDYFHGYDVTVLPCLSRSSSKYACVKSLDYQPFYNAYQKARAQGFNEALLINSKGYIFEASRSNVFLIKKETLYPTSLELGCLNGITRRIVMECARELKIPVKIKKPKIDDFINCDETFLTNSIIGVMPITKLKHKAIESGRVGDLTYKIRSRYIQKLSVNAKPSVPNPSFS